MSEGRHDCADRDFSDRNVRSYPCSVDGKYHENGKWWCHHHAPSMVAKRQAESSRRWGEKLEGERKIRQHGENKIWNEAIEAAAELMEKVNSQMNGEQIRRCFARAAAIRKLKKP